MGLVAWWLLQMQRLTGRTDCSSRMRERREQRAVKRKAKRVLNL